MAKSKINNAKLIPEDLRKKLQELQPQLETSEKRLDIMQKAGLGVDKLREQLDQQKRTLSILLNEG